MKTKFNIIPLEERIVLDAAVAAVIAHAVTSATADTHVQIAPSAIADASSAASHSPIIYVNASATGSVHNGTSWATAYVSLQDALNQASQNPGDQIWVAKGTYVPSQIYSPDGVVGGASGLNVSNLKTFDIPNDTTIYGGFKAGMTSLSQANPNLYPTILSGDLLGNDINSPSNPGYAASKADNAWHVVTLGNDIDLTGVTASLNGLTIEDGYANGPAGTAAFGPFVYNHNFGGGEYAFNSNVTMNNDTFKDNYAASDGGGVFTNNTNLTVSNTSFLDNAAVIRGGGLESLNTYEGATAHTSNLVHDYFQDNTSTVFGGAVVGEGTFPNVASSMNIQESTFVHNSSPEGGAITIDSLTTNVNNSTFTNNVATVDGGALATTNIVDSLVGGPNAFVTTVTNSTFVNNTAEGDAIAHAALNAFTGADIGINFSNGGGALDTYVNGHLVVNNSVFLGNEAKNGDGGALLNGDASANNADGTGLTSDDATTSVSSSIFIGNSAHNGNGGALASETDHMIPSTLGDVTLTVQNSIILGNKAHDNGGAIYVNASVLADKSNVFLGNVAGQRGDELYATASDLDGILSSASNVLKNQILLNKFLLLDSDDLYVM